VIREATPADLEPIAALCGRSLTLEPDATALPALLWHHPELRFVAVEDGDIAGVLLGRLRDTTGHVDLLAVHPERRRAGLGTGLVDAFEVKVRAAGGTTAIVGGAGDRYAWPGIDLRYTPAVCLFERLGYQRSGDAVNMTANLRPERDTAAAEARLAADGIEVRRLRPDERSAFGDWMTRWGGSWPQEAGRSADYDVPRCHVAVKDGVYLGFACHGGNRDTWFGPMGTAEVTRGKGIGGVLLTRCLNDQRAAGLTEAEIGWVGPISFYSRTVDARIGRAYWIFSKSL